MTDLFIGSISVTAELIGLFKKKSQFKFAVYLSQRLRQTKQSEKQTLLEFLCTGYSLHFVDGYASDASGIISIHRTLKGKNGLKFEQNKLRLQVNFSVFR